MDTDTQTPAPTIAESILEQIRAAIEAAEHCRLIDELDPSASAFDYDRSAYDDFAIYVRIDPAMGQPSQLIHSELTGLVARVRTHLQKHKVGGRDCRAFIPAARPEGEVFQYFALGMFTFMVHAAPDPASPGRWRLGLCVAVDPESYAEGDD